MADMFVYLGEGDTRQTRERILTLIGVSAVVLLHMWDETTAMLSCTYRKGCVLPQWGEIFHGKYVLPTQI